MQLIIFPFWRLNQLPDAAFFLFFLISICFELFCLFFFYFLAMQLRESLGIFYNRPIS